MAGSDEEGNEHVYDDCDVENAAQITHARGSALSSGWGGISWTNGYDADGRMNAIGERQERVMLEYEYELAGSKALHDNVTAQK